MYVGNSPNIFVDPTGMFMSPIYDFSGNFLGTDSQGLQGDALIMNAGNFTQGMAHADAVRLGIGILDLPFSQWNVMWSIANHYVGLRTRPDYDGFVTPEEGIAWALLHPGALDNPTTDNRLYIDAAQLDFGNLSATDFDGVNQIEPQALFTFGNAIMSTYNNRLHATVYALGRVNMILLNRKAGTVQIVNDDASIYDWNSNPVGPFIRDFLIRNERMNNGLNDTHGVEVRYYGTGSLNR